MTTPSAASLRALLAPHLEIFSSEHRTAFEELLRLAAIGERALAIIAGPSTKTGPSKAARPARRRVSKAARVPKTPAATSVRRPKPTGGPTLRETVVAVLKEASRPLGLAEIETAVKAKGHASKSANFAKLLGLTVGAMKAELRRVSRGVYTLA